MLLSYPKLIIVRTNFHCHDCIRVQQGEVWVGPEPQTTILKSCICVGFYHIDTHIGAISHITGFSKTKAHHIEGALNAIEQNYKKYHIDLIDTRCFIIGGTTRTKHIIEDVFEFLHKQEIQFEPLDILGNFHRKLHFNPKTGVIRLYKKEINEVTELSQKNGSLKSTYHNFLDSKKRLITGASLFFRNSALLDLLVNQLLPEVLSKEKRFHVWCAGCSIGMEVYSIAMVIADWLNDHDMNHADVKILGTDISNEAISIAQHGVYPITEHHYMKHKRYFDSYTDMLQYLQVRIKPSLKFMVTFRQHDIFKGSRGHRFELVVCDHVFQYFSEENQRNLLPPLLNAVNSEGIAFISSPSHHIRNTIISEFEFTKIAVY
ncbi:MAG: hypothetical protein HQK77_20530, partial [Desulfobacterales bacterium]|nr:hypothetical protein [Desulfobacterales bacterium]